MGLLSAVLALGVIEFFVRPRRNFCSTVDTNVIEACCIIESLNRFMAVHLLGIDNVCYFC